MTPEEMAAIHADAMVHSAVWGVPTIEGFLAGPGAIVATRSQGFALGRVIADEAELLTVAVAKAAQGRGTGRACLKSFEQAAANRGARRIFLEVAQGNLPAIRLYVSMGYMEMGRRAAYYTAPDGTKSDAILMSKPLSGA